MSTTNKRVYLSGPMSNYKLLNHPAFDRNTTFLRNLGYEVISPAEMDRELGIDLTSDMNEEQYLNVIKHDYAALLTCDSIAFMPGWEKSRGAKLESDFANVLKLDRYRVDASKSYLEKELILGITGWARSGKDSIAQEFVSNKNFQRIGFADSLKEMLYALNPIIQYTEQYDQDHWAAFERIQQRIDMVGWEEAKSNPEVRKLLQRLGAEGGRITLGEDIWVKTLFNSPTSARIIIPDVRFANEAAEIKRRGGKVIRVMRPGVGPANDHSSEQLDFDIDYIVHNDRTTKDAYLDIVNFLEREGVVL